MKNIKYEMYVKITCLMDFNGFNNMKNKKEFADDMTQFICDEVSVSGGVAIVDVLTCERTLQ